jgi:hypothetical protein
MQQKVKLKQAPSEKKVKKREYLHNGTQKKAGRWRYLFWDL